MKLKLFAFWAIITLLFGFGSCAKEELSKLDNYETHQIPSNHLQRSYTIHILYPQNYDTAKAYSTLFLLDANDYFLEMVEVITQNYKEEILLIGINYNNFEERVETFTYPADSRSPKSGQANKYIQFLNDELLPFVANDLHIKSKDKTIAGHSLTGYFTSYLLFQQEHPNLFDHIISASPSFWWGNSYIFQLEQEYSNSHPELSASFFTTMGDLEGIMMNTHFNAFVKKLEERHYQHPAWSKKVYYNISHRNSPIISFEEGLAFIY